MIPHHRKLLGNGGKRGEGALLFATKHTGFNQCITKLQKDIQVNFKVLQYKLEKDHLSKQAKKALGETQCLLGFNQNVSYCMGKLLTLVICHLCKDTLHWYHLKTGVKQ